MALIKKDRTNKQVPCEGELWVTPVENGSKHASGVREWAVADVMKEAPKEPGDSRALAIP